MSVLGKVLIILNLLAAGAFGYLTLENWKVRQEFTYREFENVVKLGGIPVDTPTEKGDIPEGRVPFSLTVNKGNIIESLEKDTLTRLIPKGGDEYGGDAVANQTEEVVRLQKKLKDFIAAKVTEAGANGPVAKLNWTRLYLLNLSHTGAERDGVNALFDLENPARAEAALRDLPLVARTSSQTAALKALVEISTLGDPQAIPQTEQQKRIDAVRLAVKGFLKGEASHGVADADAKLKLKDTTIEAAFRANAGEAEKAAIIAEATADPTGFKFLADLAVNSLRTRDKVNEAKASILGYVDAKAITPQEKLALKEVVDCIVRPANFVLRTSIDTAGTQFLEHYFEAASMTAATKTKATGNPQAEKARRIAHLLYHIDSHRHNLTDAKIVADRKDWHSRVVTIVGMQEYVRAAEAQASEFAEGSQRLLATITQEEADFRAEYQQLVQKCQALHAQWQALEAQLNQQKLVEQTNQQLLMERQTEYDKLVETLAEAQVKAKEAQDNLKKIQDQRFQILLDLRNAQQALLRLEGELRRLELNDGKPSN